MIGWVSQLFYIFIKQFVKSILVHELHNMPYLRDLALSIDQAFMETVFIVLTTGPASFH